MIGFALAAPAAAGDGTQSVDKKDPNEIVCEKQEVLGSRLAKKRVCMTRAQWDDKRREERQVVGRSQINACLPTKGSNC